MARRTGPRETSTSRQSAIKRPGQGGRGPRRTVVGTLLKAGRLQEAVQKGEEELKAGAGVEIAGDLGLAYWQLGMPRHAARSLSKWTSEQRDVEQWELWIRLEALGEVPPSPWPSTLRKLQPGHAFLLQPPAAEDRAADEHAASSVGQALYFLRRRQFEPAQQVIEALLAAAETRSLGDAFAWGLARERAEFPDTPAPWAAEHVNVFSPSRLETSEPAAEETPALLRVHPPPSEPGAIIASADGDEPVGEDVVPPFNHSAAPAAPTVVEDEIIEAAEDDEPTEELYVYTPLQGAGLPGLKLLKQRPAYDGEDDEVIVIERETGKRKMDGQLWFRPSERPYTTPSRNPARSLYTFDDEDDRKTEIKARPEESPTRRVMLTALEADDEVVVAPRKVESERYTPYIPTQRNSVPEEKPQPPVSNFLNEIERALAERDAAAVSLSPSSTEPPPAPGALKAEDELTLDLEDLPDKQKRPVRGTGEGPVARLNPVPAEPLAHRAAPPPFTRHQPQPVQGGPSAYADTQILPDRQAARTGEATQIRSSQQYFRRSERGGQPSKAPFVMTAVLTGLLFGAGYALMHSQESRQVAALTESAEAALQSGAHPSLLLALSELRKAPANSEDARALAEALAWSLWSREGLKLGDKGPDFSFTQLQGKYALYALVATGEAAMLNGAIFNTPENLQAQFGQYAQEPYYELILGRLAAERARWVPDAEREALEHFERARALIEENAHPGFPVSKAEPLMGMAVLASRLGQSDAVKRWEAVKEADPENVWAQLYLGIAALPTKGTIDEIKGSARTLQASLKDKFSPRQRATLTLALAKRVASGGSVADAEGLMREAVSQDPSWPESALALSQSLLDRGKVMEALKVLAPLEQYSGEQLELVAQRVYAQIENANLRDATEAVRNLSVGGVVPRLALVEALRARLAREVDDLASAEAYAAAGLKLASADVELLQEQAQLSYMQRKPEAVAQLDALLSILPKAGRGALVAPLKAQRAVLKGGAELNRAVAEVMESSSAHPRAAWVLAEDALKRGDASAVKLLEVARSTGDLPKVELAYARLLGAIPEQRDQARAALQALMDRPCVESPLCQEARRLQEQLR